MIPHRSNLLSRLLLGALLGGVGLGWSGSILAQAPSPAKAPPNERAEPMRPEAQGIGVDERLKAQLPLNATFYNEKGDAVTLGKYFTDGKPVILQLGYFGCPMLCDLVAQATVDSLAEMDLGLGKDFKVLYVSIDPRERPELANAKKVSYLKRYLADGRHDAASAREGWHFLTGAQREITELADTVGFRYRWIEAAQQYSHPGVIIFLAPDGTVSRYLYGVKFDPKVVKLSLVDASAGKAGSIMDQIIMLCFHFDPNTGRYSLQAIRLMKLGGALTVLALGGMIGVMALKGRRMRGITPSSPGPQRGLAAVLDSPTPHNDPPSSKPPPT